MISDIQVALIGLSGVIVGGVIVYLSTSRIERQKRHSGYIQDQLDRLYGPLFFLSNLNGALLKLNRKILEHHVRYFSQEWSDEKQTQENLHKESDVVLKLSETYTDLIVENNTQIITLLQKQYSLVDHEDVELFTEFTIDVVRMNNEVLEKRGESISLILYKELGNISYSRPEFLSQVETKFRSKQELLNKYH